METQPQNNDPSARIALEEQIMRLNPNTTEDEFRNIMKVNGFEVPPADASLAASQVGSVATSGVEMSPEAQKLVADLTEAPEEAADNTVARAADARQEDMRLLQAKQDLEAHAVSEDWNQDRVDVVSSQLDR